MIRTWSRWHTLVAGLALIVGTNAVVLAGIAYNRSGEPMALLRLSERELRAPGSWGFESENSGLALGLVWRVASGEENDHGFGWYGSRVTWLDRRKLVELGFDVSVPAQHPDADRHYERQLPREALIVMELDGPAYQVALKRAEERAARPKATRDDQTRLASERDQYSRLFLVDAGHHYDALRARYPDKSRYAIVRGKVSVRHWTTRNAADLHGGVSELSVSALNVPVELREVLGRSSGAYTATVAFGQRLEPWFTAAQKSGSNPESKVYFPLRATVSKSSSAPSM
jgi:hypothetical protein